MRHKSIVVSTAVSFNLKGVYRKCIIDSPKKKIMENVLLVLTVFLKESKIKKSYPGISY